MEAHKKNQHLQFMLSPYCLDGQTFLLLTIAHGATDMNCEWVLQNFNEQGKWPQPKCQKENSKPPWYLTVTPSFCEATLSETKLNGYE